MDPGAPIGTTPSSTVAQPEAPGSPSALDAAPPQATFLPLHPDALKVDLWVGAIHFTIWMGLLTVVLVVALVMAVVVSPAFGLFAVVWGLIGSLLAFLCFYWPRVRHRHVSFLVDERGLQIKRGVLWRSHVFLARSRIQHTDVSQGPLQRRLGLARLVVHTAGTHNASTTLSGISHDQAQQMRDQLTEEEDAVSDGV